MQREGIERKDMISIIIDNAVTKTPSFFGKFSDQAIEQDATEWAKHIYAMKASKHRRHIRGHADPEMSVRDLKATALSDSTADSKTSKAILRTIKLPLELREMIYFHVFNDGVHKPDADFKHSQGAPKWIRVHVNADVKGNARFLLTNPHPAVLNDMKEYLKNTCFCVDGRGSDPFIRRWCKKWNTYDLISKVRTLYQWSLVPFAEFLLELIAVHEVVIDVLMPDHWASDDDLKFEVDLMWSNWETADFLKHLSHSKSLRTLILTLDKSLHKRKGVIRKGAIREQKMVAHAMRDVIVAKTSEMEGWSIEVELSENCHFVLGEVDVGMLSQDLYACCRERLNQ